MSSYSPLQSAASSADAHRPDMYDELRQEHESLQRRYDELQIMVRHQQKMFIMVKELYGEQVNRVCIADLENSLATTNITALPVQDQAVVQALCAVASAHDTYTSEHAQRMTSRAVAIARRLGSSEEEIQLLHLATLFHDIGKVGIPDTLLRKSGPLTPEEWEVVRQHPRIGEQILEEIGGIFSRAARIVVSHHERWDGMGYPDKLAGEVIPMSARIISVIDAYDAMTSERSYRKPLSDEQARMELKRCMGSQFDPRVVEAFLDTTDDTIDPQETTEQLPFDVAALP
jgi:HD-GYP domain-containing protein (c-di-GMP phosphodiesterase class II)